jgi:hypothetical protein
MVVVTGGAVVGVELSAAREILSFLYANISD